MVTATAGNEITRHFEKRASLSRDTFERGNDAADGKPQRGEQTFSSVENIEQKQLHITVADHIIVNT